MTDGEIVNGRVWFCFDAHDLEWLLTLIPRGDEFRRTVALKIRELERETKECSVK